MDSESSKELEKFMIPPFINSKFNADKFFSNNKIENSKFFSIAKKNVYECSICLSISKDPCYILNCRHIFCTSCIQRWRLSSYKCPYCRGIIDKIKRIFRK